MCQVDDGRWLPQLLMAAILVCAPLVLIGQNAGQEAQEALIPDSPAATIPQVQATPEQIGDTFLAQRRYQEAIAAYKKDPHPTAAVWNKMGIAYELFFDAKDAERCYKESLRLDPRNSDVINNLGTVYDSQKKYRQAERMYRRAIKVDSNSAVTLKNLGTNQLARHKYEKGQEAYRKALALDPHIFDQPGTSAVPNTASLQQRGAMNYYMAKSCVQAGMPERAIQFLRAAVSEGFTSPKKVAEDSSFAKLRDNPAFQQLIAEHTSQ